MTPAATYSTPNSLAGERASPLVVLNAADGNATKHSGLIVAGISRERVLPEIDCAPYDLLLTTVSGAPRPWVSVEAHELNRVIGSLESAARRNPIATRVLAQVLRINDSLNFGEALLVESFAYSTLLGGEEFRIWLETRGASALRARNCARVRYERNGNILTIHLCNPQRRNAFDARLRDELLEALRIAEADSDLQVELRADGPNFCSGGDLHEFGQATDLAKAHAIRTQHSVAGALHQLGKRLTSYVHGACIGAGIEIPAAAHIAADPDTRFSLPELAMGLIPGAGGTASLPRRTGRQRVLFWALAGTSLDAQRALDWGLIDRIGAA